MSRRYWSLLNMLVWAGFVLTLILRFYYGILTSGSWFANVIAIGVIVIGKFFIVIYYNCKALDIFINYVLISVLKPRYKFSWRTLLFWHLFYQCFQIPLVPRIFPVWDFAVGIFTRIDILNMG